MKTIELIIAARDLTIKQIAYISDIIPVIDIVSPQKTIIETLKNITAEIGDIVILKDGFNIKYIGVLQDKEIEDSCLLYTYPIINVTDADCLMIGINGSIYNWVVGVFTANFINTDDELLKLPFEFVDQTGGATMVYDFEDGNFFDALLRIFLVSGVYIDFNISFLQGKPNKIICTLKNANDGTAKAIRYDNPLLFKKPNIEFSQSQNVNKVIFRPTPDNLINTDTIVYYLLENNTITTNQAATGRIKGVVQSIQYYTDEEFINLVEYAEQFLIGEAYSHKITLMLLKNEGYNFKVYDKFNFIDSDRTYITYITRIEDVDRYKILTLGVLRTTLTDKLRELQKMVKS